MAFIKKIIAKIRLEIALRFFRRIHHYTHRIEMKIKTIDAKRVLVFAPHPDDEVIGMGGTLALLAKQKSDITIAWVASDAADKSMAKIRRDEASAVAAKLGAKAIFMNFKDSELSLAEEGIAKSAAELIKAYKPEIIFSPFPSDHHRDHQATACAVCEGALKAGFKNEIWAYEIWSTMWPNTAVDIAQTAKEKAELINMHKSQVAHVPYAEASLGLNRFRGLQVFIDYAEGFFVVSPSAYKRLCRNLFMI